MEFEKINLYKPKFYNDWDTKTLYELAEWINGKAFKKKDYSNCGIPIIKIAELNNGISSNTKYTNRAEDKYYIKEKDLLFAWSGNPDTSIDTHRFNLSEGYLNQHIFKVIPNQDKISSNYFYYLMKYLNPNFKEIARNKQTTGLGHVTVSDIKNIHVNIPKLEFQDSITGSLYSIDKKIEINNKIIENLEAQAQAIFKSWFVDFEPFQEGNFVESELGLIPEGWEVNSIGNYIDFDIGGGWGKDHPVDRYINPAYVIRGTDIPRIIYGEFNKDNYRYHTETNLYRRRLEYGDLVFESSGGSTNQDLGRMLYMTNEILEEYDNNVMPASFCKIIRINNSETRWYIYNLLKYSLEKKFLKKYEVQSTGISNFSFKIFKDDYKIIKPNIKDLRKYYEVTGYNIDLASKLSYQNQTLAQTRDTLLPKLMSGEIDVSNIKIDDEDIDYEWDIPWRWIWESIYRTYRRLRIHIYSPPRNTKG